MFWTTAAVLCQNSFYSNTWGNETRFAKVWNKNKQTKKPNRKAKSKKDLSYIQTCTGGYNGSTFFQIPAQVLLCVLYPLMDFNFITIQFYWN